MLAAVLILGGILLLIFSKYRHNLKYSDLPGPSPFLSLPIIGHGYLLGDDAPEALMRCQEKYGDIFRFDLGSWPTVFLCRHSLIANAFKMEAFSGRTWNELPAFKAIAKTGHKS